MAFYQSLPFMFITIAYQTSFVGQDGKCTVAAHGQVFPSRSKTYTGHKGVNWRGETTFCLYSLNTPSVLSLDEASPP